MVAVRNYHPHVSAKLEEEFARNEAFRDCREAAAGSVPGYI